MSKITGSRIVPVKFLIPAGVIILVCLLIYSRSERSSVGVEIIEVLQGDFVVDLNVRGEIKSSLSTMIMGPRKLGSSFTIEKLVPEGERVEKGDFLIKFDTSAIETKIRNFESDIAVKNGELDVLLAMQKAGSIRRSNNLQKDRLNFELAQLKFSRSDFETEMKKQEMEIDFQKSELNLLDKIDENERFKFNELLERNKILEEIKKLENELTTTKDLLKEGTINAPASGVVIYKEVMVIKGGMLTMEKVKEGTKDIYYSSPIVELPNLSKLHVEAALNEVEVGKVKPGHEVIISLDTGDRVYFGSVSKVAVLATKEYIDRYVSSEYRNVYKIEISVSSADSDNSNVSIDESTLLPGTMTTCRIITDRMEDAVYVPVQSVFEEDEEFFVYLAEGGSFTKKQVKTGIKSKNYIVISEGLQKGQFVALRNPYSELGIVGKSIADLEALQSSEQKK
ncbi:efflux RND transporter periplasmic adaptor subunit [candidate division KSB1 bacterium]|nr:efflux RND transporter periplasmic adaptor subunit [candidate division KSB1 bacterium]